MNSNPKRPGLDHRERWIWSSAALLVITTLLSLGLGRYAIPVTDLAHFLAAWVGFGDLPADRFALLHSVIIDTRLPRVLAAILVGAGLSVSGAAYQAVFRNPLVSPGLLGVLSGCAFGAACGIVLGLQGLWITVLASLAGLLAVGIGVGIASLFPGASILILVLGGIVSNALFTSLLSIVKYLADPQDQLPSIVYWMLGSLGAVDTEALTWTAPLLMLAIVLMCLLGRAIDALSLSDDEAHSLGVSVRRIRYGIITLATLISALTVSIAGMIGWVGLLIPHLARLLVGPRNAALVPMSALLGGSFLLAADDLARTLTSGEIPLGIITELLGAIAFVLVLNRVRRGWL
ncbi:FecCD family ABC transporter permease [Azomonas macrocytogenes]|uniref:Iron complex transport system permease protein n=1 Tax=Azomonas macrocytogenes TaxID=69962 RepID=A0A839T5Z4_AZOMA|nr:iron ABC transporter permease [Azomonas macrocytogenes]MBB3103103.1 iron complex transport system permease protein [Azomonas macrocytogenes]